MSACFKLGQRTLKQVRGFDVVQILNGVITYIFPLKVIVNIYVLLSYIWCRKIFILFQSDRRILHLYNVCAGLVNVVMYVMHLVCLGWYVY